MPDTYIPPPQIRIRKYAGVVFFGKLNGEDDMSLYKNTIQSLAIGAAFFATISASSLTAAAALGGNPFAANDRQGNHCQLAETTKDAKCGANTKDTKDAKCGAAMKDGKCGAAMKDQTDKQAGDDKAKKPKEAKCGGM
jgi:hypothetical protein